MLRRWAHRVRVRLSIPSLPRGSQRWVMIGRMRRAFTLVGHEHVWRAVRSGRSVEMAG